MRQDVEEAIRKFNIATLENKKRIERAVDSLWDDETVIYIAPTNAIVKEVNSKKEEKIPGIFIFTNKRVVFYYKVLFTEKVDTFEISEIKSIKCSGTGLTGGHIKVHTVVKSIDILTTYDKVKIKEIQELFDKTIYEYKNKTNNHNGTQPNLSEADELRKYKSLLDDGIISQEEFDIKKKQILGM